MATNDTGTSINFIIYFYMYTACNSTHIWKIIDFFEEACHDTGCLDSSALCLKFQMKYPHIMVFDLIGYLMSIIMLRPHELHKLKFFT